MTGTGVLVIYDHGLQCMRPATQGDIDGLMVAAGLMARIPDSSIYYPLPVDSTVPVSDFPGIGVSGGEEHAVRVG